MTAPTKTSGIAVIMILQEENIERMKQHDPMEFQASLMGVNRLNVESLMIAYASDDEFRQYEELARKGDSQTIIKMVMRGWKVQGDDSDDPYELLNNLHEKPQ